MLDVRCWMLRSEGQSVSPPPLRETTAAYDFSYFAKCEKRNDHPLPSALQLVVPEWLHARPRNSSIKRRMPSRCGSGSGGGSFAAASQMALISSMDIRS